MITVEACTTAIQLTALIVIVIQLFILYKTYKADHERRKKQATIEYLNMIRPLYRPIYTRLEKNFGKKIINVDEIEETDQDDIKELLGVIEHFCVGVNVGVYDLNIVGRMAGLYFRTMYERLLPYIQQSRKETQSHRTYCEFEDVYDKLRKRSKLLRMNLVSSENGEIRHS